MEKNEILKILETATDECDSIPMSLVRKAFDKLSSAEPDWIEIFEDDEKTFPPVDEEGYSDYILISLENFTIPLIGQYRVDETGGAFNIGDDEEPALRHGFIVNAWRPLPAPFRRKERLAATCTGGG